MKKRIRKKSIALFLTGAMLLGSMLTTPALALQQTPNVKQPLDAAWTDTSADMQRQSNFTYVQAFENSDGTNYRMRANIDYNWRFSLEDDPSFAQPGYDDSEWRLLNLPHDWSIEGEYAEDNPSGPQCGYLPTGIAWYRKTLEIPSEWRDGRQVSIEFDGVFRNSEVYIDGVKLGERPYGWISFAYDITEHVQGKEQVEIAVRVDNSLQSAARWYTGSGIYGHVWILSTQDVHIDRYGTYITTPAVNEQEATVAIETTLKNDTEEEKQASVRIGIYDRSLMQKCRLSLYLQERL